MQRNGKNVSQVMSRTGSEAYDVFEVVFYPTLAPHGDDDSGSVLQSGRVKEWVKRIHFTRASRRTRGEGSLLRGRGKGDNGTQCLRS